MAGNYVLLERIELNASAASVVFSNIPQTGYTDLKVVISAINTVGLSSTILKFNGSSSGYTYKALRGSGTAAASFDQATWGNGAYIQTGYNINGSTPNSNELYIPNYAGSSNKSVSIDSVQEANTTTAYSFLVGALWANSAAITTIELSCDTGAFASGSTFSLYGIAKLGTTPAIAPKAEGGNIIDTDGTYWYHTFLTNGTFTPSIGISCDYLVVAGGGGGGNNYGGGGGAGGLRTQSLSLSSAAYPVVIGSGGAANANGSDSVFNSITSTGGGRGGTGNAGTGSNGGSGGGGSGASTIITVAAGSGNTPSTSPSQGNNGGTGGYDKVAGGGGGSGAAGQASTYDVTCGNGGSGTVSTINGSSVTYAGGGGGGGPSGRTAGTGGSGGGANGLAANSGTANSGTANTGGGGGGGPANGNGGAGGSGIVIIRYAV